MPRRFKMAYRWPLFVPRRRTRRGASQQGLARLLTMSTEGVSTLPFGLSSAGSALMGKRPPAENSLVYQDIWNLFGGFLQLRQVRVHCAWTPAPTPFAGDRQCPGSTTSRSSQLAIRKLRVGEGLSGAVRRVHMFCLDRGSTARVLPYHRSTLSGGCRSKGQDQARHYAPAFATSPPPLSIGASTRLPHSVQLPS